MKNTRAFNAALAVSAITHAALIGALAAFGGPAARDAAKQASYIFIRLQPAHAPEPVPAARPAAPAASSAPRLPKGASGHAPVAPEQASRPAAAAAHRFEMPPTKPMPARLGVVSSQELLSDPEKGQVFSQYFQSVKSRIQTVAARHQKFIVREKGKVEIDFILDRDGRVVTVEPHTDGRASLDPLLRSRAIDIIRESEPFQRFPADVRAQSISFNITLVFDG